MIRGSHTSYSSHRISHKVPVVVVVGESLHDQPDCVPTYVGTSHPLVISHSDLLISKTTLFYKLLVAVITRKVLDT